MKQYTIKLEEDLTVFYKSIAKAAGRSVEDILADTLQKTAEMMLRKFIINCLDSDN